ncbi:SMC-Scp complex subunit ScpB [Chromohalobacter canadensis]|uniref:SMC-Scp complex subunit ScpB n=1 Tax=Chromohalobacter canadensis TaxID=141389 RepID=UPI0021BFFF14|nr:SMC-Scp complex subunit ScpB [Chromohalobacter canadensis]MCT8467323.1 SMC-Scp complex subunit ScpB [Chromohalobacter canadensis]MCT8470929.1 SMC-Scp complex subunit ScpB [Chromohalobacter canadensis]MCT8497820.1 SMC-Scp complex subunit ScpB [Chromohalobacter canadensis]
MNEAPTSLDEVCEAALLAAGEPLTSERLESLFDERERPSRGELRDALARLGERLEHSALELIETASGFQVRIRARFSPWISRLWDEKPQRYSRALLETLALIAYRQPVTRGDIEEVRGVSVSSSIMRTLTERGWIRVVGQRDVPGRPSVYATTRTFLDDFGLKTLDALPPMHELKEFETRFEEALGHSDASLSSARDSHADNAENTPLDEDATAVSEDTQDLTTAGMADDQHAETASERSGLSFAELETRLAERARRRTEEAEPSHPDDDAHAADAEHSTDETTFDS